MRLGKKIGMVIYADPFHYPSTINAARILSKEGYSVDIIGRLGRSSYYKRESKGEKGIRVLHLGQPVSGKFTNTISFLSFLYQVRKLRVTNRYSLFIGYDMRGFMAAFLAGRHQLPIIYHNHDLTDIKGLSWLSQQVKKFELKHARQADLVVFPEANRAAIFKQQAALDRLPLIVANCQMLTPYYRTETLRQALQSARVQVRYIVLRLGTLGPGHAIENTIRSVKYWHKDDVLVLCGVSLGNFIKQMEQLVEEDGLKEQVFFFSPISYDLWYQYLHSADLGIALYQDTSLNSRFMSTAGNKLFLYLSAGIPALMPNFTGFKEMNAQCRFGMCVDPESPRAIGQAVNEILSDRRRYQKTCDNAYRAHITEYNYEHQFQKVLEFIKELVG